MDIPILCEQFCDYCSSIRGYSKSTIRKYKYVIGAFCKFTGITDLTQVTEEKVRKLFYYGRTERKWCPHTFIIYKLSLLVFFRWCIKQGYMQTNPVTDIETPKPAKKIPVRLTKQDALRLLEIVYNYPYENKFLRYRNHAIFTTFIFAGLRKQELLNLKYTDVDLENLTLFVRQGKGNKDRILPISYTLAQSLKRYIQERNRLNKTCPDFFVSSNRNLGYTDNGLKRLVLQMSEVLGLKFTVHKLRHTFATLMLEGGCDIYNLSKMMGHSSIQTTTIYLSASVELLRSQMTKHPLNTA
jgi:site-specific recombinase XerD